MYDLRKKGEEKRQQEKEEVRCTLDSYFTKNNKNFK